MHKPSPPAARGGVEGGPRMAATETTTVATPERRGRAWRRRWESLSVITRSRVGMIGLGIVVLWILVAIFAPVISPHNPLAQDSSAINQPPSRLYPLGTDHLGRDNLSRLFYGSRTILILAPLSVLASVVLGTFFG